LIKEKIVLKEQQVNSLLSWSALRLTIFKFMIRFSVIMANYNYGHYLDEAIQSVLQQTYPADEIIIVDDGSTDHSRELLIEKYQQHPGIKIIFQDNAGQMAAFDRGYAACTGDVIAFLDTDDRYDPHYLEKIAAVYEQHVDAVLVNAAYFGDKQGQLDVYPQTGALGYGYIRAAFDRAWPGGTPSMWSFRRRIAQRVFPIPAHLSTLSRAYADVCLILGAMIMGAFRYYIHDVLVYYRAHRQSHSLTLHQSAQVNQGSRVFEQYLLARVRGYYLSQAPLPADVPNYAVEEFSLMSCPNKRELDAYARILWNAHTPWIKRSRRVIQLYHLYFKKKYFKR